MPESVPLTDEAIDTLIARLEHLGPTDTAEALETTLQDAIAALTELRGPTGEECDAHDEAGGVVERWWPVEGWQAAAAYDPGFWRSHPGPHPGYRLAPIPVPMVTVELPQEIVEYAAKACWLDSRSVRISDACRAALEANDD